MIRVFVVEAIVALGALAGCATSPTGQPATAYEGARLIVGDGRVIENATLVVEVSGSPRPAPPAPSECLPAPRA